MKFQKLFPGDEQRGLDVFRDMALKYLADSDLPVGDASEWPAEPLTIQDVLKNVGDKPIK